MELIVMNIEKEINDIKERNKKVELINTYVIK